MNDTVNDYSHLHVLVVEDNKINQLLIKNMLKKFGFVNFDSVDTGKLALHSIEKKKYDIILMDIQLPEMNGYETAELIRAKNVNSLQQTPIIALTGEAQDKNKTKAYASGMNAYIVKPFMPEELLSTMLKCLNMPVSNSQKTNLNHSDKTNHSPFLINRKLGMDLRFLAKYTGNDDDLAIRLIELFLSEVPEALEKLELLIPMKNWKEVNAVAHKIKSCITIFELHDLRSVIVAIEDFSLEKNKVEEIPALFHDFKIGCRFAITNLEQELLHWNADKT